MKSFFRKFEGDRRNLTAGKKGRGCQNTNENQLSDSDSKETVGSSRKKMKYANEELLLDSSDVEYTFNTEESEGYRLINAKNLSTAV